MARLLHELRRILTEDADRTTKAGRIVEAIQKEGSYRWVGIYDVDLVGGIVSNIAWSGPSATTFPVFKITEGITSRAIAQKKAINVGDVAEDPSYLTALKSTQSEIVVPIRDASNDRVLGTIDVESEKPNAFDPTTQSLLEEAANVLKPLWTLSSLA